MYISLTLIPCGVWADPLNCPEVFNPLPEVGASGPTTSLCSPDFAVLYGHTTKTPLLVFERLTRKAIQGKADRRSSNFKADTRLDGKPRAELADYRNSGYDRAHMAPAADFKFDQARMDESFYLSNIAPQVGANFNRGIWRHLEEEVRAKLKNAPLLYVFTGPIFYDFEPTIGPGRVVVPDAFFKVIYDPLTKETTAYLMENKAYKGRELEDFEVLYSVLKEVGALDLKIEEHPNQQ